MFNYRINVSCVCIIYIYIYLVFCFFIFFSVIQGGVVLTRVQYYCQNIKGNNKIKHTKPATIIIITTAATAKVVGKRERKCKEMNEYAF